MATSNSTPIYTSLTDVTARTGKPANVVTAAIARELTGFVWAIARQVTVIPS